MKKQNNLIIYQAKTGAIQFQADSKSQTLWATQAQMAQLFETTPQNITIHLKNIFKESELLEKATCKESLQVQKEGNRNVKRKKNIYNLDAIISVGYRISSVAGTKFRQWATKTLRTHITQGYTINKAQVSKNYQKFMKAVAEVKKLLPASDLVKADDALELAQLFASTWFSLDAYDKSNLPTKGLAKKEVEMTADELNEALIDLKKELLTKKEATDLFGSERKKDALTGIVGNVLQSFGGEDLYATLEEKAAHLLYFIVKNHPFVDGNKRSGAFAFVWFLNRTGLLEKDQLTPPALTALTLLVAESDPKDKERIVGLILLLLKG